MVMDVLRLSLGLPGVDMVARHPEGTKPRSQQPSFLPVVVAAAAASSSSLVVVVVVEGV